MKATLIFLSFLLLLSAGVCAQGTLLAAAAPGEITLENCARINDADVQFGPALYGEELVFVGRNKRGAVDPRTRKGYFNLFRSELDPDGIPGRPRRFSASLSSNYNEGPVSFSHDNRVIYFTRTQLRNGTTVEDMNGTAHLGIFSAYRAEYDWAGIRPMPFNGTEFGNQHPSVSANGRRVFFASDRAGGYGGFDLYFSDHRDGRWGPAINLGPEINTEANEGFPFIHPSGRLFFSSDGHGGHGGYDVYMIDLSGRHWGKLYNLPEPINGVGDDVGLVLTPGGEQGYLVSNRAGGMGSDDIYLLRLASGLASLEGASTDGETVTVFDGRASQRIAGAEVWLTEVDEQGKLPAVYYSFRQTEDGRLTEHPKPLGELGFRPLRSDGEGSLRVELTRGKTYEIRVAHPGYEPATLRFVYTDNGPTRPLVLTLYPEGCRRVSGRVVATDGNGVGGRPVSFWAPGQPAIQGVTDLGGYFEVCLPEGADFTVSVPGAVPQQLNRQLISGQAHPRLDFIVPGGGDKAGTKSAESLIYPLEGLEFYGRTSQLREGEHSSLRRLVELLRLRPGGEVLLIGHAFGPEGTEQLLRLSEERVETVRRALEAIGVGAGRIRTLGYGNRFPLRACTECVKEDWAFNSRLEAKLIP